MQILKDWFQSAAAMVVMELEVSKKFMVTERRGATMNTNLNMQWTPLHWSKSIRTGTCLFHQFRQEQNQIYLQLKTRHVLVGSGRNTTFLAGMLWHTSGNGKASPSPISCRCMCMTITRTKVCNKYMHTTFPINPRSD